MICVTKYVRYEERSMYKKEWTMDEALAYHADQGYRQHERDKYGRLILIQSAEQHERGAFITLEMAK